MKEHFDFVVVGGGSAGAVVAARLSEDASCRVALVEAGERPPEIERMPVACWMMQLNPATDWMYAAEPGRAGHGLKGRRMRVPRGKMLGGSSGINYMAYVRGHPGDYDAWARGGATGWSYKEVLPFFLKSEGFCPGDEIIIDAAAHNSSGPLSVAVRSPVLAGAREFVAASQRAGIPAGDYNGRDRNNPGGVVSLLQTSTRKGQRASTYRAFLEGEAERRPNLRIITGARATRILLQESAGRVQATGIQYLNGSNERREAIAEKEVILSAGAIGSPHLLLVSGIGPRNDLERAGVRPVFDSPHVGRHLKDHVQVPLFYPAPGAGISVREILLAMGPDALRQPVGPLPADASEDARMAPELQALKQEASRRLFQWATTGAGLAASSLYDACAWYSTGLGDAHSHDAQIGCFLCGGSPESFARLNIDPLEYFDAPDRWLGAATEALILLANPVLPHSEGEMLLESADPLAEPLLRMNYFADPHDLKVMLAILRRTLEIADLWPEHRELGPLKIPPHLARKHRHREGELTSDALLEDLALHYSLTVYHLTSTCRMGDVVDSRLRVRGVGGLRIADASVMPNIISGNTNAPSIMIGEKAAEMIAREHGIRLGQFVGGGG